MGSLGGMPPPRPQVAAWAPRSRARGRGRGAVAEEHLLVDDAFAVEQRARARTVRAAFLAEDRDRLRRLQARRDVREHRVRVGNLERIAFLPRLDEHLLD